MSHTRPTDCELSLNQGTAFSSNTVSDLILAVEKKTTKTQRIYFLVQTSHARICPGLGVVLICFSFVMLWY